LFYKEFASYSLFMFLSGFAGTLTVSVDKLMLGDMLDLSSVGLYTVAYTLVTVLTVVGSGFGKPSIPLVATYWNANEEGKIKQLYCSNANQMLFIGGFLFCCIGFCGESVLGLLGEEYRLAYWALFFLALGEFVNLASGLCGTIISFSRYYKFDFWTRCLLAVITVLTNLWLIPKYGITGAALASLFALAGYNIIKVVFVFQKFKMIPYDLDSVKISLLLLMNALVMYAGGYFILGVAGQFVYCFVCFVGVFLINKYSLRVEVVNTLFTLLMSKVNANLNIEKA
jgi:O-antigen/teichoic acid export membrane protein